MNTALLYQLEALLADISDQAAILSEDARKIAEQAAALRAMYPKEAA